MISVHYLLCMHRIKFYIRSMRTTNEWVELRCPAERCWSFSHQRQYVCVCERNTCTKISMSNETLHKAKVPRKIHITEFVQAFHWLWGSFGWWVRGTCVRHITNMTYRRTTTLGLIIADIPIDISIQYDFPTSLHLHDVPLRWLNYHKTDEVAREAPNGKTEEFIP